MPKSHDEQLRCLCGNSFWYYASKVGQNISGKEIDNNFEEAVNDGRLNSILNCCFLMGKRK